MYSVGDHLRDLRRGLVQWYPSSLQCSPPHSFVGSKAQTADSVVHSFDHMRVKVVAYRHVLTLHSRG